MNRLTKIFSHTICLVLFATAISAIVSFPFLLNQMQSEPDAFSRANISFNIYQNKLWFFHSETWLPLHFIILKLGIILFTTIEGARVITYLLGIISVPFFYLLSEKLTENKKIAILSTFLYILYPQRIILSTQTLSEPVFCTFLLVAISLLLTDRKYYILSLLSLNIAHGIRYESWFLIPFFALVFWQDKKITFRKKTIYSLASILVPVLWISYNYSFSHVLLFFIKTKVNNAHLVVQIRECGNFLFSNQKVIASLAQLISISGILIAATGFFTFFQKKRDDKLATVAVLPLFLLITLSIQLFSGTMEWLPDRYLYPAAVLLLPIIAVGFSFLLQKLNRISPALLIIFFVFAGFEYYSVFINTRIRQNWRPGDESQVINFVASLHPSKKITYFYNDPDKNRLYSEEILRYSLDDKWNFYPFPKNNFSQKSKNSVFVFEKEIPGEALSVDPKHILLNTKNYIVGDN